VASKGHPGRPEGPLDPAAGAVADLAARLRQLREDAGRPSYRQLARAAFYSHSALSQAAAGRVLPSLAVTLAFVQACGGDRQEWTTRWHATALEAGVCPEPDGQAASAGPALDAGRAMDHGPAMSTVPAVDPMPVLDAAPAADARPAVPVRRGIRGRLARFRQGWRLPTTAGLASLAGVLLWWGLSAGLTPAPATPRVPLRGCASSVEDLVQVTVPGHDGQAVGWVGLRYSKVCHTAWARFSPNLAVSPAGAVTITVEVSSPSDGMKEVSQGLYFGHVQSREIPLPHGLCAQASVTVALAGQPPASTATACLPSPSPAS